MGRKAFGAKATAQLIDDILHTAPAPPSRIRSGIPGRLEETILKCLEKDPENRYQSAKELTVDLRRLTTSSTASGATLPPSTRVRPLIWAIVSGSVLTLLVLLLFLNVDRWRQRLTNGTRAPRIQSLAVLPLENLSGDPAQEYFADGMTDELIAELSKIGALKVISRTSVMQYKGAKKPLPQISRELGVDGIIEGSVAREGEQVRITVQLLDGPKDRHLWAEHYQREMRGILALQSEVARAITSEIKVQVTPAEQAHLANIHPVNPAAHEAYLKGQSYPKHISAADSGKGIDALEQAVSIDPNYALAYAALADAYVSSGNGSLMPASEAYPRAKAAALRALQLDPNLSDAHQVLADVKHFYDWDFSGAETEYKRALELSPSDADQHASYGYFLCRMGRSEQAIAEARRALDLDPLSFDASEQLGVVLHYSRRYDEAMAQYKRLVESFPKSYGSRYQLARLYIATRRYEDAALAVKQLEKIYGTEDMLKSFLAVAYAFAGKKSEATAILNELIAKQKREFVRPYLIAEIYIGLGEKQKALDWLEKAYQEQDDWVVWFRCDPIPDGLRSEPRFQELMRRIGFPS